MRERERESESWRKKERYSGGVRGQERESERER